MPNLPRIVQVPANLAEIDDVIDVGVFIGTTRLAWAVQADDHALLARLLAAGANPDKADKQGLTPLMQACGNKRRQCFESLMAAGANANRVSDSGHTAASLAAGGGDRGVLKALAHAGADMDLRAGDAWTPLRIAAYRGDESAARALLELGADPRKVADPGGTIRQSLAWLSDTPLHDLIPWMEAAAEALDLAEAVKRPKERGLGRRAGI